MDALREFLYHAMTPLLLVLSICAVIAAFDRDRPRVRWAKGALLVFAGVAIFAAVISYLLDSGKLALFVRGSEAQWQRVASSARGICFGMLYVLLSSGQFFSKTAKDQVEQRR